MLSLVRRIMSGEMSPVMMAAVLVGLRVKKETIGEITAAAQVMREFATKVEVPDQTHLVDIVGTGGDGSHTFNISTCSDVRRRRLRRARQQARQPQRLEQVAAAPTCWRRSALPLTLTPAADRRVDRRRPASASCSRPTTTRR